MRTLLVGGAFACQRERDDVGGDERTRLHQPAPLLGHDHRVAQGRSRHGAAAVLLGHEQGEPPQLPGLAQERRIMGHVGVGQLSQPRDRTPGVDEPRRRLAEQLLVVGQLEIHRTPLAATAANLSASARPLPTSMACGLYMPCVILGG